MRRILLRTALFITPGMALWALLPLIATQRLGLGADGYGALFGALGLGAIAALILGGEGPPVNQWDASAAGALYAAALAVIVLVSISRQP